MNDYHAQKTSTSDSTMEYVETIRQQNNRIRYRQLSEKSNEIFQIIDITQFKTSLRDAKDVAAELAELKSDIESAYHIIQTQQAMIEKLEKACKKRKISNNLFEIREHSRAQG